MIAAKPRTLLALAALAVAACGRVVAFGNDSESHFLITCSSTCPDGSSCACGVCTEPCFDDASCLSLSPAATCVARAGGTCEGGGEAGNAEAAERVCDVACVADAECAEIGTAHRCVSGFCRGPSLGDVDGSANPPGSGGASNGSGGSVSGTGASNLGGAGSVVEASATCCPGVSVGWRNYTLSERCELSGVGLLTPEPPEGSCLPQLPACETPGYIDAADVREALAHPDVERALAEGSSLFGWTGNVIDFRGFAMQIGEVTLELGYDCSDATRGTPPPDCRAIPEGVQKLRELLETLDMQQRSSACGPTPECYSPIDRTLSCSSTLPRFAYDASLATCIDLPETQGCGSDNLFVSFADCQSACRNDPCALGVPISELAPENCEVTAFGKCFPNDAQACLCACRAGEGALEDCRIDGSGPGVALCGQ